jgi:hypothetical protein
MRNAATRPREGAFMKSPRSRLVFSAGFLTASSLLLAPARAAEVQKLTPSDSQAQDAFGGSVAIQGDLLAVGAPFDDDQGTNSGSVYVFTRTAGVWTQAAKITAN